MVFRKEKVYTVFQTPFQGHIAQASSFKKWQVTGVENKVFNIRFPAKLASFSKSGKTKDSCIELFDVCSVWIRTK